MNLNPIAEKTNNDFKLKVMALTFNLGNSKVDHLDKLMPQDFSNLDIIAFGFQESVYSLGESTSKSRSPDVSQKIEKQASNKLKTDIITKSLAGMITESRSQIEKDIEAILTDSFKLVSNNAQ